MHPIVGRLSLPGRPADRPRLAIWPAAGVAVVWTVATSLVPIVFLVLIGWLASGLVGGLADPFRFAIDIWLAAHGVPIRLDAGALTLRPLGLTAVVLALLWRAGRWVGRNVRPETLAAAARAAGLLAAGYGTVAALLALAATDPAARPDVVVAAGACVAVAALIGGLGVLSGAGLMPTARARLPLMCRVAIDAGAAGALALVGLAGLLLGAALIAGRSTAYDLASAVGPDTAGWPLLLLVNLLLLPNAVLAALAYATGPGFTVGTGTSVMLGGAEVAALPPLSLFAAVPGASDPHPATYAVLAIPLLAGIAAGLTAVRRSGTLRPEMCALSGLGAGFVAGLLVMVTSWAAAGGLGTGRLATIGPTGWMVGAAVAVEIAVVAAVTAWVACPRSRSTLTAEVPVVLALATPETADASGPSDGRAKGEETVLLDRQTG